MWSNDGHLSGRIGSPLSPHTRPPRRRRSGSVEIFQLRAGVSVAPARDTAVGLKKLQRAGMAGDGLVEIGDRGAGGFVVGHRGWRGEFGRIMWRGLGRTFGQRPSDWTMRRTTRRPGDPVRSKPSPLSCQEYLICQIPEPDGIQIDVVDAGLPADGRRLDTPRVLQHPRSGSIL